MPENILGHAGQGTISFPGLGIYDLTIQKEVFPNSNIHIHWYGVIIALGFIVGLLIAFRLAKKAKFSVDTLIDIVLLATPFAIIGARIYYVVQKLDNYIEPGRPWYENLWEMCKIWEGGMAIYGAVIAGVLVAAIYCHRKKINVWKVLDIVAPALLAGQGIGRWGNFVNQEAYGGLTDLPWRMELYIEGQVYAVHPTFLYESLWNILGVIVMLILFKKRKFNGEIFWIYMGWYGIGRAFVEGLRTDSLYLFGNIRTSQVLGVVFFIVSVIALIVTSRRYKKGLTAKVDGVGPDNTQYVSMIDTGDIQTHFDTSEFDALRQEQANRNKKRTKE